MVMNVFATAGIRFLELVFALGWIGSLLVLLLSAIEDAEVIFEKDEPAKPENSA
jgi:hypothetical protein